MSESLSLSAGFFSRRRGVAPAAPALARDAAAAEGGWGARGGAPGRRGRSLEDEPGDGFGVVLLAALAEGVGGLGWPGPGAAARSRVVFERSTGLEAGGFEGVRWEVERSRVGETAVGGVGAGRYAVGAGDEKADWVFFGGGGGDRYGRL